ncbi:MAG TPA: SLC13 family permease [Solirubrobacteraceae bacterium]|nr:SLC13 family permease [Solirubrobacteraceae bacterium]
MLIVHLILAAVAVATVALRPRSNPAAAALIVVAALDLALGGSAGPVLRVVGPLVLFLCAALSLAKLVARSGLAERAARLLAAAARGRALALYALACVLCACLTAAVSLDGAVVLMVPILLVLKDRFSAPIRPLFLGVVAVANAASIALPQGNPTNLVVIARLGLSPAAFTARMLLPGLSAAALCAVLIAALERRALAVAYRPPRYERTPLSRTERGAAIVFAAAAIAAWIAPIFGIAPWWPFSAVVAVAVARNHRELTIPYRIAIQVLALLVAIHSLGLNPPPTPDGLLGLLEVAGAVTAVAAVANNLPASIWAGSLLAGQAGYAASIGLAIGSMATPQGSVATLIAADLAGDSAPAYPTARFALIAGGAVVIATLLVWAGL